MVHMVAPAIFTKHNKGSFQKTLLFISLCCFLQFAFTYSLSSSAMTPKSAEHQYNYPIGRPGKPWNEAEKAEWKAQTKLQRSYKEEVLDKLETLKERFDVEQYGALPIDPERYPLYLVKSKTWSSEKPSMIVTGGVHGYETSGVQGALLFLQKKAHEYTQHFNILVAPCISPWSYEHIQRWQEDLKDPNRSFKNGGETYQSKALIDYVESNLKEFSFCCHMDLHETTDTDATEFMPAKYAMAGEPFPGEIIPDGFYLVGDQVDQELDFLSAAIESVRKVTHIAPPDGNGNIIDVPMVKDGIILVPIKELGLCCSFTGAPYCTTTEVYPDSPKATDDICNEAQVACIAGGLDYILARRS